MAICYFIGTKKAEHFRDGFFCDPSEAPFGFAQDRLLASTGTKKARNFRYRLFLDQQKNQGDISLGQNHTFIKTGCLKVCLKQLSNT